ncbi:MAG: nucleotidyltransferase family protein [Kiritimatiellae bacterium]|nr:nucleotidyltransferase family protein [Kiritimatiellia bacterium]
MGQPKALLKTPGGIPLARHQAELLSRAGCAEVVVVLGSEAERIAPALSGCRCVVNPDWKEGRMTSVQAAIRAFPSADGFLILPVDTVGVKLDTLKAVLASADERHPPAVRPICGNEDGKVVWISRRCADEILRIDPSREDARLDVVLRSIAVRIDVDDPAIHSNVNTPEDWKRLL